MNIKNSLIQPAKDQGSLMRLNYFISNKYILFIIIILVDIFLFFLFNYVINVIAAIPSWLNDLDHGNSYFSIGNIIPRYNTASSVTIAFYVISYIFILVYDFILIYRVRSYLSDTAINVGQKGDQRWSTIDEIKKEYKEISEKNNPYPGNPGIPICRYRDNFYIDDNFVNNLIIGITRSGKDEMFLLPSEEIYSRAENQPSLIISDPKLGAYKASKEMLEKRGYDVYLFNLDDPLHSMGFNPLKEILAYYKNNDSANAELLAQSFSYSVFDPDSQHGDAKYFASTAASLLTGLIIAHIDDCLRENQKQKYEHTDFINYEKAINLYSIINLFTELSRQKIPNTPNMSMLDIYFNERPALDRAKMKYAAVEVASDRTKGSVYSSMLEKLTIFTYENIAKMTVESSINLSDIGFGDKPIAIFLGIPDYDKSAHFLSSVFIRQVYFVLAKKCGKVGHCKRPVKFQLNEFGNIPRIEALSTIMTECLERKISFDFYIQSYSQVSSLYGDDADTIIGNCGNQIYLMTNDDNTAEKYSKLLGNETVTDLQRTGSKLSLHKTLMESTIEKPLLRPNELMELKEGFCVIKRVMKRRDLEGEKIVPHPIFNCDEFETTFKYRYMYLQDVMPNPSDINLDTINTEDRSHIKLSDCVWDYNLTFRQFDEMKYESVDKEHSASASRNNRRQKVSDSTLATINSLLLSSIGEDYQLESNIFIDDAIRKIESAPLRDEIEKKTILAVLNAEKR